MSGNSSKIKAYVGFAKKSRAIIFGVDDIIKSKKAKIILVSSALAESSKAKIEAYAKEKNVIIKNLDVKVFNDIMDNENIKTIAITSESLADAVNKSLANS